MLNWITENYIEIIASILGIVGVYLTIRQNIWNWPVGLANVLLTLVVCFIAKLYADVVLQLFYVVLTLYGWYFWIYGGEKKFELPVRKIFSIEFVLMIIIGIVGSVAVGYLFAAYTKAAYPYFDSILMVWSLLATYGQAKKIIEQWIMWIIIDLAYIPLYALKHLFAFAALSFIFTILAVIGFLAWKKEMKLAEANPSVLQ
jgi:nicotinamide mononucleotide transporter